MASYTSAQSRAERAMGPSLSIDHERAIAPVRLTAPNVGRCPVTPHRVEGDTIEPSVSDPIANGTQPADTAAAGPADEPLEPWSRFQGFFVVPSNHTSPHASAPS